MPHNPNFKNYEVSTDSPVGKAIVGKEVGESVKCYVSKQEINIKIKDIQKVKVKQL